MCKGLVTTVTCITDKSSLIIGMPDLERKSRIVRNLSSRLRLILTIVCVLLFSVGACTRHDLNHGTSNSDFDCDTKCEAQVKVQSVGAGLKVTDAQWRAAFASAMDSLAHDPEWLELIAEMKDVICQPNSQKFRDWNERESKRQAEEMDNIGNAIMPGDSPELNEARAKIVKIKIIVYMYTRAQRSCPH